MFERLWPLTHVVPPELAHRLGLTVLRVAWPRRKLEPRWEFRWKNLRFRTRAYGRFKQDFRVWASDAYVVKSADLRELKLTIKEILSK